MLRPDLAVYAEGTFYQRALNRESISYNNGAFELGARKLFPRGIDIGAIIEFDDTKVSCREPDIRCDTKRFNDDRGDQYRII